MIQNIGYGWKRGLPSRAFPKMALAAYPPLSPSKSLIGTGFLPPIWDQGATSSCTGHGCTRAKMFARAKQGLPSIDLSRLFPYYNARLREGSAGADDGATIEDVILAAQQFGDCAYSDLPTDPSLVLVKPSDAAYADAIQHTALNVTRIWGANSAGLQFHVKHCIDGLGLPAVFGITVYESFESQQVADTGIVPMPGPKEQAIGGHCIVGVAYDDPTQMLTCDNSWGRDWGLSTPDSPIRGERGRFKIPYAYVFDPDMADDWHAIMLEK